MTPAFQTQVLTLLSGSFVALHTGSPGPAGAGNESTDSAYARQAVTLSAASDADADGVYQRSNSAELVFPALAAGQTLYFFSLWSAVAGGTCLLTVPLSAPKTLPVGGVARFPIGELIINGVTS
ncbi:MAG: phage tail fiber protein [Pseudomonas sp.]